MNLGNLATRSLLRSKRPDSTEWIQILGKSLTLTGTNNFAGLQAQIQALGDECANISVGQISDDLAGRMTNKTWSDEWLTDLLLAGGVFGLGEPLRHDRGLPFSDVVTELDDCKAYLDANLTGVEVKAFAYPYHRHDRQTMRLLKERGYAGARDGEVGYFPLSNGLLGSDLAALKTIQSWDAYCRFSLPLNSFLVTASLKGKTKTQMEDYLYSDSVATGSSTNYGYASLMEAWKANHTLLTFYTHGNAPTDLTAAELEDFLEIIQADQDIWIAKHSEIAEWANARHAPNGATYSDEFVYEPTASNSADDMGGTPWNGYKMAFSMSFDDIKIECYNNYFPVLQTLNFPATIYVALNYVTDNGGSDVSLAQLQEMQDSALVEIGGHSTTHDRMIDERSARMSYSGSESLGYKVAESGADRIMTFYKGNSLPYPLTLTNLERWYDIPNMGLANGATPATITDRAGSQNASAGNEASIITNFKNSLSVLDFDGTDDYYLAGTADVHSNTRGLMVFLVYQFESSDSRPVVAHFDTAPAGRLWRIQSNSWGVFEAAGSASPAGVDPTNAVLTYNNVHVACLYWEPGSPGEVWCNNAKLGEQGSAVNTIDVGNGANLYIGNSQAGGTGTFNGKVGDIVIVSEADPVLRRDLFSYLGERWDITQS